MADDSISDADKSNIIDLAAARDRLTQAAKLDSLSYGQQRRAIAKELGISVSILDKEIQKRRRAPTDVSLKNLILSDRGAIVPILANAIEILSRADSPWKLKFEEFSQRAYLGDKALEDSDLLKIAEWIQRQGCHAGRRVTDDAVFHIVNQHRWHAVRDWLESTAWDGTKRLDAMLIDHAGAADTELTRAFTAKWMIQAIARIYRPGCQADATLVLDGPQGVGKSSLLRALFGDDWFSDHLPNLDSKDAQIQLLGIWCIELSELAAITGKENAKTKQFLTSRDDRFRLPFDKIAKNHPRASVFAGTVNPGASGYLKDETGGRRYWPIIVDYVDVGQIEANRDQLWAEALTRFKSDEVWHLPEGDLSDAARDTQADRYVSDPWQEAIAKFIETRAFVTLPDIFTYCLDIGSKADWDQLKQTRVSKCLAHIGWSRKQRRIPKTLTDQRDRREWGYEPPRKAVTPPQNEDERHQSWPEMEDFN